MVKQIPLDKNAAVQCSFQSFGHKATGTYRFITGFSGLTAMPTEFQRINNKNLEGLVEHIYLQRRHRNHYKGHRRVSLGDSTKDFVKIRPHEYSPKIKKSELAQQETKWLGFHFSQTVNKRLKNIVQGIEN